MSKFYKTVVSALCETALKQVKVTYLGDYVGYILEENDDGHAVVYVVSGENPDHLNRMMSLEPDQYQSIGSDQTEDTSPLNLMKHVALEYLMNKGLLSCRDQDKVEQLMSCPCVNTVEKFLRGFNITDTEIIEILKNSVV